MTVRVIFDGPAHEVDRLMARYGQVSTLDVDNAIRHTAEAGRVMVNVAAEAAPPGGLTRLADQLTRLRDRIATAEPGEDPLAEAKVRLHGLVHADPPGSDHNPWPGGVVRRQDLTDGGSVTSEP